MSRPPVQSTRTQKTSLATPALTRRQWLGASSSFAIALATAPGLVIGASPARAQDIASSFKATGNKTMDHTAWTELLKTYVKPASSGLNEIDYKAFKANGRTALTAYLRTLESTNVTLLTSAEQFAYWANLYNAKTIDIVLDHYPVATIRDIDISGFFKNGPWDKKVVTVNKIELSLNDIEHVILRGNFADPRVHYAVNCASIGCPNLGREAFIGAELESQLNAAARSYVNSPRGFVAKNGRIRASKIYSWFQEDFGNSEAGVLKHALVYAEPELAKQIRAINDISGFDYDWALNDVTR